MNEQRSFEAIKNRDEAGREYWSARNLGPLLDYKEWRNFQKVISKAIISCEASGQLSADHFVETNKMVELGSGASRNLEDFHLSRYACYLVVQNGDPAKSVIAAGQTYFALQTRRQELEDDQTFKSLREDEKRLFLRNELKEHNKHLVETAQQSGVETTRRIKRIMKLDKKCARLLKILAAQCPRRFLRQRTAFNNLKVLQKRKMLLSSGATP